MPLCALDPHKTIRQFTHTSWSVKDGIPGPVAAIAQTPDGYLWLGTHAGLYRFDGQKFISWEPDGAGDKVPRSAIAALTTARDGSLWIGFKSNVVGRVQRGALKTYTPVDGLHTGGVLSIVEDTNGCIWAGGPTGFSRFVDGRWVRVGDELGYRAPGARQLAVDHRGALWAATDGLNFGLNTDSVRVNTVLKLPAGAKRFEATGQPAGFVAQLVEGPDGNVWMVEASDPRPTVRPVERGSSPVMEREVQTAPLCVLFDGLSMWIGLLRGGIRQVRDFRRLDETAFERFGIDDGLSSEGVRAAFKDREGNFWFGTNRGVDRFRENKATPLSTRDGLAPNPHVVLTSTRDGKTWFANSPVDLVQWFDGGRMFRQKLPAYSRSDSTRILTAFSKGTSVWLGGSFGLAQKLGDKFSFVPVPGFAAGRTVEAITMDSSRDLWIALWRADRSGFKRLHGGTWTDFEDRPELPTSRCRILAGDLMGRVWLGFATGEIVVYEKDQFHRYTVADGLPPGKVLSISFDSTGHVWVGSEGGLSHLVGGRFVTLTKENGLPGAAVSAVLEDDNGLLWIAGELGVVRVSRNEVQNALKSPSYRMRRLLLDTIDGLPGSPAQEDIFPSATKSADGRLWFATTDGIAVIDPRNIPMNTVRPNVVIQSVTAGDRNVALAPSLHFAPTDRNLEIGFAALSLSIPERVQYRFKLEGYDADWRGPFATRTATYTNLPPRPYRFRVAASNNDGLWNEAGSTLDFDIAPTFYETNWFPVLCSVAAMLVLWLLYRWRLQLATARLDLRHAERLSERERIARELHDTLLQSIQGLMLRFQAVAKEIPGHESARIALEKALDRADEVMAEGRGRVAGLRAFYEECEDFSEALSGVARDFSGPSHPAFRVVVEGAARPLHPLVRDEAYRIGREAIVNAFRHARARHLEVEVCYAPKEFRVRIQDDGSGIEEAVLREGGKASHWGLRGMTERAEKIGGRLTISSKAGVGTEIELKVPGGVAYDNSRHKAKDQTGACQ